MMKFLTQILFIILLFGAVISQDPGDCEVNPSSYEFSMNIIASVQIDGILSNNENNLLGAFVDSECRGVVSPLNYAGYDIFFLVIYSNTYNDTVTFAFYNADSGSDIILEEQVTFVPNLILGAVVDPFPLHGTGIIMGDLNQDGVLDILDIIQLVAIIMGQVPGSEYQYTVGDTNNDQVLDVVDIVTIVGWIMY